MGSIPTASTISLCSKPPLVFRRAYGRARIARFSASVEAVFVHSKTSGPPRGSPDVRKCRAHNGLRDQDIRTRDGFGRNGRSSACAQRTPVLKGSGQNAEVKDRGGPPGFASRAEGPLRGWPVRCRRAPRDPDGQKVARHLDPKMGNTSTRHDSLVRPGTRIGKGSVDVRLTVADSGVYCCARVGGSA